MKNYLAHHILLATYICMGTGQATAQSFDLPPDISVNEDAVIADNQDGSPDKGSRLSLELALRGFRSETAAGDTDHSMRGSAHLFGRKKLTDNLGLLINLRLRVFDAEGSNFTFKDNLRFDVQELAFTWAATDNLTFQLGRVNIRNGVASGFNPTDWFKADSRIDSDSLDPSDLRKERLGVLAFTATSTFGSTLAQFGYRPKITAGSGSVLTNHDVVGLGLDRTNPTDAYFLKLTPDLGGNLSGTINMLLDDGKFGAGFEVSGTIGDNLILYGEIFTQDSLSLADNALQGGAGSPGFRAALGVDTNTSWLTQASVGATWSLPQSIVGSQDISLSLEYHYNGAGLNNAQINTLSGAVGADLAATGSLRNFASVAQEPLARNQMFSRFAWNDFWKDADIFALGFYVPSDDSGLVQISADFPLNDNLTLDIRGISTFGDTTSVYGAIPTRRSVQMGLTYVF